MFDHEYARELVNKKYDESYTVDFFNRYKDELSNVRASRKAVYMVISLLGDNVETAKFISRQYDIFYGVLCYGNCTQCKYSSGALLKEKNIEYMSCFTYYILSILLHEV